ncbi:hypothetical protein J4476_03610 [Candidatus Woesearchaeota archaeon]|nr:MAG: hypothetical protein QT09_C0006G0073 [archaeon GW2011_AR18]MBS3161755.1 hypothetical protein [Candidatus Woesearchaeota archaeon]HIH26289.1 hypothetical protein [Nanoarchaeota archaeon]
MDVKISFNTEKESIDDLKKLISALQDLVNKREKASVNNIYTNNSKPQPVQMPKIENVQQSPPRQSNSSETSAGGGRLTPYIDMSDTMSRLFSGGKV